MSLFVFVNKKDRLFGFSAKMSVLYRKNHLLTKEIIPSKKYSIQKNYSLHPIPIICVYSAMGPNESAGK